MTTSSVDTSTYEGSITPYNGNTLDCNANFYDDYSDYSNNQIIINFNNSKCIIASMVQEGIIIPKYGNHYYHEGHFYSSFDSIYLNIPIGSTSYSTKYIVYGVRK